jgi:Holliday junction resolvasome RuvABC endonuclease subunit
MRLPKAARRTARARAPKRTHKKPMGGLITFDTATVTGWAFLAQPGAVPLYGKFSAKAEGTGKTLSRFRKAVERKMVEHGPHTVGVEKPIKTRRDSVDRLVLLYSFVGVVQMVCAEFGAFYHEAESQTVAKHFIGHGGLEREDKKFATIKRCRLLGWDPQDDNVADALALLDYFSSALAPGAMRSNAGPLFGRPVA